MKTAIVFFVLLVTVFCHPVKRSASSSESSEEQAKHARLQMKPVLAQVKAMSEFRQEPPKQAAPAGSDESSDSSDDAQDSASDGSDDSEDEDDNDSSESTESEDTDATTVVLPPEEETTLPPTTVSGRGDSLGYGSDYKKSNIYADSGKFKEPSPYKSYDTFKMEDGVNFVSKKSTGYDDKDGNSIEKTLKVYKAVQIHEDQVEEDTSTPEMDTQGLDPSSGDRQGVGASQGADESEDAANTGSTASDSDSASAADGSDSSQSSEEATATPGAADSESSQSSESQESDSAEEETTEPPVIVTAK